MHNEFTFIFRLCLFALIHSLFAASTVKRLITGNSQSSQLAYRMTYNIVSLTLLVWVMTNYHNSRVIFVVPGTWSLVMHMIQLICLLIAANCIRQTGVSDFLGLPHKSRTKALPRTLITNGCYGIVRHPLYLFSILLMLFNPILNTRWIIFTLFSISYFIIGALIEEKRLSDVFGEQYSNYRKRVPFIIPDMPGTKRMPETVEK